jgi:eukaryotic-like serine/threonine-protein kinase
VTVQPLDEEAIFHAARAMTFPVDRANFLAEACGDNQALRARVEGLLKVYAEEKSFAGMPSAVLATIEHRPITEQPGTVIGPYKLMEQIGEGGFGLVFVAEQYQGNGIGPPLLCHGAGPWRSYHGVLR